MEKGKDFTIEEKHKRVKDSQTKQRFKDIEDIIVVYISEFDIF